MTSSPVTFRDFIRRLMRMAKMPDSVINELTTENNLNNFKQAFTHCTVSDTNYEVYETIGDVTLNKCIIWFFRRMIPDVTPEQLTLLKIKFASTKLMSVYARELGFDNYILANDDAVKHRCKILEDVLESFIGCLEFMADKLSMHSGYAYAYNFVSVYVERYVSNMSISEQDLLDPISTLKNLSDKHRFSVEYVHDTISVRGLNHVSTNIKLGDKSIAVSVARTKKQSKIQAAELALQELKPRADGLPHYLLQTVPPKKRTNSKSKSPVGGSTNTDGHTPASVI